MASFLQKYDENKLNDIVFNKAEIDILNNNITLEELDLVIKKLKTGRSPGLDLISAEFIKASAPLIKPHLQQMYNYVLHSEVYPDSWAEGLRSALPKEGGDVRPITIVPMYAKIFEMIIDNRITFINNAFRKQDIYNRGFLKGSRTQDNIFILTGCIQKQLNLGNKLFVAFVDFKKAFNYVNHNILFFKLIKSGLKGKCINVLRSMYSKIKARVKINSYLYDWIKDNCGTNQGGPVSPNVFRYMLVDLKNFLETECGIVINESEILLHLLWADDLILLADSQEGLQKQLDGLFLFVSKYQMIVNELKTKIVIFGTNCRDFTFTFNSKTIEIVEEYKYLGCLFNSCVSSRGNIFRKMVDYSSNKALKASYAMVKKCSSIGYMTPQIGLHLFDTCVNPILNYCADIWCTGKTILCTEKVQLKFLKYLLGVKTSTCNLAIYGEMGRFPLLLQQKTKMIEFWFRLERLPPLSIAKQTFNVIKDLHNQGFNTWLYTVEQILN